MEDDRIMDEARAIGAAVDYIDELEDRIAGYERILNAMRRHASVSGRHVSVVAFAYRDNKDYKIIKEWLEERQ